MRNYRSVYQTNPVDYEATIKKARELGIKVELGGGRNTKSGESPNAHIILNIKNISSKIVISRNGNIQIYYPSRPNLKKCVQILEQCLIPEDGKKFTLKSLGPDDPLDTSFELTTIDHWQHGDLKYAKARVHVYQWLDPKTEEAIFRIPDREGRVNIPGTNAKVKSTDLGRYLKKCPYIYQGCVPVSIHTIDKDDEEGNRIITGEKLRWKAIQELKRIAREHPRLKLKRKK